MKRIAFVLLLVCCAGASSVLFNGCDALSKATEIDVNMPIKIDINAAPSTLPSFQVNAVDVSTNQTYNDNKSRIKGADITSVSMILNSYVGTPPPASALYSKIEYTLKFDPSYGDNTEYTIGSFDNILAGSFIGTEQSFNVTNAALNSVLDNLKDRPKFTVYSKYTLASGAGTITSMTGTITINFKLTASAL